MILLLLVLCIPLIAMFWWWVLKQIEYGVEREMGVRSCKMCGEPDYIENLVKDICDECR
jgi:hypothetical protein